MMGCLHGTFFVTLLTAIHASAGEYGDRIKNASETTINLEMQESRHHSYAVPHPRTELPVNFQAPYTNARDYWSEQPRRTFYDYEPQFSPDTFTRPITEGINSFYGLMNHFFGAEERPPRRKPNYPNKAPYDFETQYNQQPYRQQYLPNQAKPLRASVVKLEPYRTSSYTSTTAKYYPQFVKILNDVLVENSYNQLATLGFEDGGTIEKPETTFVSNIVPTTYKPKKRPFPPKTTPYPASIQDQLPPVKTGQDTRIPYVSEQSTTTGSSKIVFHETVTPADIQIDVRNAQRFVINSPTSPVTFEPAAKYKSTITTRAPPPIVFETTTKKIIETTTAGHTGVQKRKEPTLTTRLPTNLQTEEPSLSEFTPQVASLSTVQPTESSIESGNTIQSELSEVRVSTTTPPSIFTVTPQRDDITTEMPIEIDTTTTEIPTTIATETTTQPALQIQPSEIRPVRTELIQNMEPLENSRFNGPFPKRLDPLRVTTDPTVSADYVTDLTIKGLSDERQNGGVNIRTRHISNVINMTTVLGFEIAKVNGTAPPPSLPNFEDERSLDAKILKDTNWDGYQPSIPTTTQIPLQETTITTETQQTTPSPVEPTENLLTYSDATIVPLVTAQTTTETVYTTLATTESVAATTPTPAVVENNASVVATRVTKTISRSLKARRLFDSERRGRSMRPPNFDDQINIGGFMTEPTSGETARGNRQYMRRARVQAFTPNPQILNEPDISEPRRNSGSPTRSLYARRSRPNVTVAIGNRRTVRKNDEIEKIRNSTRIGSRNDLYRGRKYPSQLKRRTTEESMTDTSY